MNRPRDRISAAGLLPRMEARPWRDGKTVTYRYHPMGGAPINLGTDRAQALRTVANMIGTSSNAGTIGALWEIYQAGADWHALAERTRADYVHYSVPLLAVFANVLAADITAPDVARYLRVERVKAKVRANREVALLGNLIGLAIERGEATHNPCRGGQVARNKERPRTRSPARAEIDALVAYAMGKGGQWRVIIGAAEFAALGGSRKVEFLGLSWAQVDSTEVRLMRAKQHDGREMAERLEVSASLAALLARLRPLAHNDKLGAVFPNRHGNPYTAQGFQAMWGKLMRGALAAGVIARRFTFHDLRAHYVTEYKTQTGNLADLHASPTTTARVYERSKLARRKAL